MNSLYHCTNIVPNFIMRIFLAIALYQIHSVIASDNVPRAAVSSKIEAIREHSKIAPQNDSDTPTPEEEEKLNTAVNYGAPDDSDFVNPLTMDNGAMNTVDDDFNADGTTDKMQIYE